MALAGTILAASADPARASFIVYTGTGNGGDGPLSAEADFTTGAGTLSLTLINHETGTVSSGQAISGLEFTLSTTPTGTVTGAGDSGQLIDISANGPQGGGTVTPITGNPDRWEASGHITQNSKTVELLVLGGGKPTEMILGPSSSNGNYDDMNQGTAKNFSPWVANQGTFNLDIPGITSGTTVTAVTFLFGTGPDTNIPGVAIPEPSTLVLAITGLSSLAVVGLSRRRRIAFGE